MFNVNRKFEYFDESKQKTWDGPFYFIQGADIQFGFISRELHNNEVITWDEENVLAESIVDRINLMNPKPRFFVMCGDLCDAMPDTDSEMRKKQEYDFKRIFGKLDKNIPLINVCGNHDVGNIPTQETVQMYHSSFGSDYFSFWCGGILFLVINSQYFFNSSGVPDLAEKHSKWIDEKLEEAQKKKVRVVIFQHIPWFLNNIDEDASYFTLDVDLRRKWLKKFKETGVEAVFCGHYHRNAGGHYEKIDMVVTSAVGGQLGNDKPGARVVHVKENKIEHTYYETANLPLNIDVNEKLNDKAVEELESLKGILAEVKGSSKKDEISISKSQTSVFSDLNGSKSAHKEINNEVNRNGKIFAKLTEKIDLMKNKEEKPKSVVQMELEVFSKGIHQVIKNGTDMEINEEKKYKNNFESKRAKNGADKMKTNGFSEFKYNPREMAEYIFWTGDEKGVVLTIEEFLLEGLMSRQEAITFLQSIKYNLDLMQSYYQGIKKVDKISREEKASMKRKIMNAEKSAGKLNKNLYEQQQDSSKITPVNIIKVKPVSTEALSFGTNVKQNFYSDRMNTANDDSSEQDYSEQRNKSQATLPTRTKIFSSESLNDDYDELMERIKVAGLLQKEYTLEEVIFELTKIMFSESLTKGNAEAQKAMQKLSTFLQNQVERGQISRNLQRKILDILSSALMHTLSEHPEFLNRRMEELQIILDQNSPISETLRQLLMLGSKRLSVEDLH